MLADRKILEEKEKLNLANYAMKSSESAGRKFEEKIDDERLSFQRDKDRIVHCKSFRRLNEKTQVFMAGTGDHYRTRLTHTLEVAQISRDLARRLELNEDLSEAVALAHDLGHPPFGHGGENALNEVMREHGGHFEHNQQSRRIVEQLEKLYPDFDGLNLTYEVLDGLIKHQSAYDQANMKFEVSAHLEAQMVNIADEIAYTNHDMDDGLRSGMIKIEELKKFALWQMAEEKVFAQYGNKIDEDIYTSRIISAIVAEMVDDLCRQTFENIKKFGVTSVDDVRKQKEVIAHFSKEMKEMIGDLRYFLYNNFYMNPQINDFVQKGKIMIKRLFEFYMKNPDEVKRKNFLRGEDDFILVVKDYIAGMTDGFLIAEFKKHI